MRAIVISIMLSSLGWAQVSAPEPATLSPAANVAPLKYTPPPPTWPAAKPLDRPALLSVGKHEKHVGGWLMGLGATSVVASAVMLGDFIAHCSGCSTARQTELGTTVFLDISGPILIITGAIYYGLGGSKLERARKLTLAPSLGPSGGKLVATLRF